MNPFDLRGPEFLLFYSLFSTSVLLALFFSRRLADRRQASNPPIEDPYLVAFLRGGEAEAVRVATLSLMDRGLLGIKSSSSATPFSPDSENRLELNDPKAVDTIKRPIEKQVLEAFKTPSRISTTLQSLEACSACREYSSSLQQLGLLHTQESRDAFQRRYWIGIFLLVGVAAVKTVIALSRGRTNILFLILLTLLSAYLATRIGNPFRTLRGDQFLQDVKSLFSNLPLRASLLRPGGATTDLAWLASAYGLAAVPPMAFPHVSALLHHERTRGSRSGTYCWGSSCGTFSGCGGGCGGGGCGGGCGGCGS